MLKDLIVNGFVKPLGNRHRPGDRPNVFLAATPRGGSTWLLEMIWSQDGFKSCSEPLDLRNPLVRKHLGLEHWHELYSREAGAALDRYFQRLARGELYIVDPLPFRGRYHRFRTDRTVFKLLHGAEDRLEHLARTLNGRVVLLLRHPIPVSLSRRTLPRLQAFFRSDYRRHFSEEQLRRARRIAESGTSLERGVVDWCFQNAVPLKRAREDWLTVTYEQMVLDPHTVVDRLADHLDLEDREQMLRHVNVASSVTHQSDDEARRLLQESGDRQSREELITRWKRKVDSEQERRVDEILELFEVDVYRAGDVRPQPHYWLEANTAVPEVAGSPAAGATTSTPSLS